MRSIGDIEKLIRNARLDTSAQMDQQILQDLLEDLRHSEGKKTAVTEQPTWRQIMHSKLAKVAASLLILAGLIAILVYSGDTTGYAFAEIVQPIMNARTATFKASFVVQDRSPHSYEGMFMEPGRMRQSLPFGGAMIVDVQQSKMLTLIPALKKAIVHNIVFVPDDPDTLSVNIFQEIRRHIQEAQVTQDESVQFLGDQKIDGLSVVGYLIKKPGIEITIWSDSKTKLPTRVETSTGPVKCTISNIVFDVELDESLFSLEIPEGYSVETSQSDLSELQEKDLIQLFRVWTDHMDGKFPSGIHPTVMLREFIGYVKYQKDKITKSGRKPTEEDKLAVKNSAFRMTRGYLFVLGLPDESEWQYAGKDVRFGDAETAIFWYRPEGSETYRVIYGDLRVDDVAPEHLPR